MHASRDAAGDLRFKVVPVTRAFPDASLKITYLEVLLCIK